MSLLITMSQKELHRLEVIQKIRDKRLEPRRVCRRPFRLSYAAMAGASRLA